MSERAERQEEREERRERRIQDQRMRQGRERREIRFFRRRRGPPPKKKAVARETFEKTRANEILSPPRDSGLDPGDPMSAVIWSQVGPPIYTPPKKAPEGTVDPVDQVVTGITRVMWGRSEAIRPGTKPLSHEEQRYRMRKRELPDLPLAMKRAQFGALNIGIGAVEQLTFLARPSAWVRSAESMVGLATSKERRRELAEFARARPAALGLQLLGGVAGGVAAGKIIGKIQGRYYRRKYLTDLPDEAFLVPDEARSAFPEPVTVERTSVQDYMKFKGEYSVIDDVDLYRGPLTYDKGLKGFRRTGHDVVPEQWVPDFAQTRRIYEPGIFRFIETAEAFRPGVRFNLRPFTPRSLTGLGFIGLSGIHGRPIASVKADTVEKQVDKQLDRVGLGKRQRRRERVMFEGRTAQRREILPDLKPFTRPRPTPTPPGFRELPVQIHRQRQRQRAITLPKLKLEPTQRQQFKQAMAIPQIQRFSYREPNLEPTFRRKRKKKGRRGDLDLFTFGEIRAYPLKSVEKIMKQMGL